MNKAELISAIARKTRFIKADVATFVEALGEISQEALIADGEIVLPVLGKIVLTDVGPRKGRNPLTGETVNIAASKRIKFKPTLALKAAVKK